ncbi:MAG: glycosyltransferase family 39 protein [Thaumarchaeota archaeon]|nr:glycosyltransferase family 39 protein [Nitrososphaerota archaeon]
MKERNEHLLYIVLASVAIKVASLAFIYAFVGTDLLTQLSTKWDSVYYLGIAQSGYPPGMVNANYAFAPLYPAFIRLTAAVAGNYLVSAVVVSNVFSVLVPFAFYFVARLYFSPTNSLYASLAFSFFPTFVTYGLVAYSEPVYIFFAVLAVYFFLKGRHILVGIASSLAVLGSYVNLLVPMFLLGIAVLRWVVPRLQKPRTQAEASGTATMGRKRFPELAYAWLFLPFLAFGLWMYVLDLQSGQLFSIIAAQAPWGTHLENPIAQFEAFFTGIFSTQGNPVEQLVMRYLYTLTFFALAYFLWKTDRWLALYSSGFMVFILSLVGTAYMSGPRLMLSAWPLILVFGTAKKNLLVPVLVLLALVSLQSTYAQLTTFWT